MIVETTEARSESPDVQGIYEHDEQQRWSPVSPISVREGPLHVSRKGKTASESSSASANGPFRSEEQQLNHSSSTPERPRDITLDGLGKRDGEKVVVAGSISATWNNKDNVKENRAVGIKNGALCSPIVSGRDQQKRSTSLSHQSSVAPPVDSDEKHDMQETAADDSPAPARLPQKKQVRFQLRDDGKIKAETTVKSLCTVQLSKDEVRKLWYTKQERRDLRRRAHAVAYRFVTEAPEYRLAAEQLLMKCSDESGNSKEWESKQEDRVDPFSYDEAIRIVVNHNARGMEQPMVASLDLQSCRSYQRCSKTSIVSVLDTQAMWKKIPCFSADQQANMIAMQLRQFSGFAAHFARILAEGDANVACGIYDESSSENDDASEESTMSLLNVSSDDSPLIVAMKGRTEDHGFEQLLI